MLPVLERRDRVVASVSSAMTATYPSLRAKRSNPAVQVDCFVALLPQMTKTMEPAVLPQALVLLDYFGIAVFAISGALLAAEKRQTFVTFIFFAVVTGVGGGTLRDLLIGAPVFWVHTNATLLICIGAALVTWLTSRQRFAGQPCCGSTPPASPPTRPTARPRPGYGVAPVPAFVMGVLTACAGGIIRDVLAGEPSILMRPELYVTAAALSRPACSSACRCSDVPTPDRGH